MSMVCRDVCVGVVQSSHSPSLVVASDMSESEECMARERSSSARCSASASPHAGRAPRRSLPLLLPDRDTDLSSTPCRISLSRLLLLSSTTTGLATGSTRLSVLVPLRMLSISAALGSAAAGVGAALSVGMAGAIGGAGGGLGGAGGGGGGGGPGGAAPDIGGGGGGGADPGGGGGGTDGGPDDITGCAGRGGAVRCASGGGRTRAGGGGGARDGGAGGCGGAGLRVGTGGAGGGGADILGAGGSAPRGVLTLSSSCLTAGRPPCISMKSYINSLVSWSCSWVSDTPAFVKNERSSSAFGALSRSNPLFASQPTCDMCLKFCGTPMSAFVSFRPFCFLLLFKV